MDALIESILRDYARRIERLESKSSVPGTDKGTDKKPQITPTINKQPGIRLATESQIKYAQKLGGEPQKDITHIEVSKMIDNLKELNENIETRKESLEIEKQIAETSKQKPLTDEQIAQIGEENLY